MKKAMYVKPEITVHKVNLEPFMTISGSGSDIPFGAPARRDGFVEEEISDEEQFKSDVPTSVWN